MSLRDGEFGYHNLERCALGFVLEPETWPVFLEWAQTTGVSEAVQKWLQSGPSLAEARKLYTKHSPDPYIRSLAERMPDR